MTGPSHYLEAERLADVYKEAITNAEAMPDDTLQQADARIVAMTNAHKLLDKAQVHATLALAAATALGTAQVPVDGITGQEWRRTICAPKITNGATG